MLYQCKVKLALALLFVASGQCFPSEGQGNKGNATINSFLPPLKTYKYTLGVVGLFKLDCPRSPDGPVYTWKKNNTSVEQVDQLRGRYALEEGGAVFRLTKPTNEEDYGQYECATHGSPAARWDVAAKFVLQLPVDTNAVEGYKLQLTCKVVGKPYPEVSWYYGSNLNVSRPVSEVLGERTEVKKAPGGAPGALLALRKIEAGDAGVYYCVAQGEFVSTTVHVKDAYAALWPFLGMCAEVLVLCTVILVYERRRAKPELDEDDAPDQ